MDIKILKKIIFFTFLSTLIFAEDKKDDVDIKKLSEAIGHMIGKNIENLGFELDLKKIISGIKKETDKKPSPMSDDECLQALAKLQTLSNEKTCETNLKMAEDFLAKNSKDKNIIELEKGKLQYRILNPGIDSILQTYNTPTIKIIGKYLDGKVFTEVEEVININELLPALKKSIVGMKKSEKREVYIHPDLAFGKTSPSLNSLIIFDIELLNIDSSKKDLDEIASQDKVLQ